MPYAHFDVETFMQSNERVMNLTDKIFNYLETKDYKKAFKLTGNLLHTIQDFILIRIGSKWATRILIMQLETLILVNLFDYSTK
jgi:hypothetical protein